MAFRGLRPTAAAVGPWTRGLIILHIKWGVHSIQSSLIRQVAKHDKREAEQHIFGEMSKKEKVAGKATKDAEIAPPLKSSEELALEEECKASPYLMCLLRVEQCDFRATAADHQSLLAQAVTFAEAAAAEEDRLREKYRVPRALEVATAESLPVALLWALIALKAYDKACYGVARGAAAQALGPLVANGPEMALWDENPAAQVPSRPDPLREGQESVCQGPLTSFVVSEGP